MSEPLHLPIPQYKFLLDMIRNMAIALDAHTISLKLGASLHETKATNALFSLYLSMYDSEMDSLQSSLNAKGSSDNHVNVFDEVALPSAPKHALYSSAHHYKQHCEAHYNLHQVSEPSLHIQWQNAAFPQALHYAPERELIDQDVVLNSTFITQQRLKKAAYTTLDETSYESQQTDSVASRFNRSPQEVDVFKQNLSPRDYTELFDVIEQGKRTASNS